MPEEKKVYWFNVYLAPDDSGDTFLGNLFTRKEMAESQINGVRQKFGPFEVHLTYAEKLVWLDKF